MAADDEMVVAEYANYPKAEIGLKVLEMRGFGEDRVSVIFREEPELIELERLRRQKHERPTRLESGSTGAAIAGGVTAPLAIGSLIAPLFIVGPLAAAAVGAATGSLFGPGDKWTRHQQAANNYHQSVAEGSILVVVHATGDDLIEAYGGLKTTDTLSLEKF